MNGVHDMGGMQDMGPIEHEPHEPVFHERWEGRAWGLWFAMQPFGPARRNHSRYWWEVLPPVDYLRMSYYERVFASLVDRLVSEHVVTSAEVESGRPEPGSSRATPRLTPAILDQLLAHGASGRPKDAQAKPRFEVGQRVRARNLNPVGHIRLPQYVRDKRGTIITDHGIFAREDTDAAGYTLPNEPQHVYTVRFAAREVWGDAASSRDALHVDLWEGYLEQA